jgi:hypothetical protein
VSTRTRISRGGLHTSLRGSRRSQTGAEWDDAPRTTPQTLPRALLPTNSPGFSEARLLPPWIAGSPLAPFRWPAPGSRARKFYQCARVSDPACQAESAGGGIGPSGAEVSQYAGAARESGGWLKRCSFCGRFSNRCLAHARVGVADLLAGVGSSDYRVYQDLLCQSVTTTSTQKWITWSKIAGENRAFKLTGVHFCSRVAVGYLAIAATVMSCSKEGSRSTTAIPAEGTRSTVLPESAAQLLAHPCSRSGPPRLEKSWRPTPADVQALESRLDRISLLRSAGLITGKQIEKPSRYYRQYVGIMVGERKLIYLNAFCEKPEDVVVRQGGDWRKSPIDVCDGGDCFWSAVYDPSSGEFLTYKSTASRRTGSSAWRLGF